MITSSVTRNQSAGKGHHAPPLSSGAYFVAKHESTHLPGKVSPEYTLQRNMKRVESSQNRRIHQEKHYKVEIYADMMKVRSSSVLAGTKDRSTDGRNCAKRGRIKGFSRQSRKRMIELLARIRNTGHMMFITLTYPDVFPAGDNAQLDADFEKFRHRFQRQYPNYCAVWRMELITRKSGMNAGIDAPHYHLIVFTGEIADEKRQAEITLDFWTWCSNNWSEIAAYEDEQHYIHGTDCSALKSRRHAYAYVSKYVGKEANDEHFVGRRWGRIGRFDTSKSETIVLADEPFIQLRRLIRRWLKNRNTHFARRFGRTANRQGFTVFGLGDSGEDGTPVGLLYGYNRFIVEVNRQMYEQDALNRGYGD